MTWKAQNPIWEVIADLLTKPVRPGLDSEAQRLLWFMDQMILGELVWEIAGWEADGKQVIEASGI